MRWSRLVLSLTGASVAAAAADAHLFARTGGVEASDNGAAPDEAVPKRFILEFAEDAKLDDAIKELESQRHAKVLRVFNSEIFRGVAVETVEDNVDSFEAANPIAKAWHAKQVRLGPAEPERIYSAEAQGMSYSIHEMTGVDKVHAAGIMGKGVKIGIVDTGVDYNHPALGGGFGPGFKVAGGSDFVGNGLWPIEGDREPDADPVDQQGHGTHVAGIIAAKDGLLTGVAPEATLYAYKVFSSDGGTTEDVLIEAFLAAFKDGVDIITSSVGRRSGWSNNAWAVVASRIAEQGVVVTISSGNDGDAGAFTFGSGSTGQNVLGIASAEPEILPSSSFKITFNLDGQSNSSHAVYRAVEDWYPSTIKNWPLIPLSLEPVENEACEPLSGKVPDLSNSVALVRRGGCNFEVKQQNLRPTNASFILFINNDMPLVIPTLRDTSSSIAMIEKRAGKAVIDTYKAGGNVTVDFTENPINNIVAYRNEENGGQASSFTSMGMTNWMEVKPDFTAPGGRILSTYLRKGYAVFSGTSMSTPYAAGVAALYISKHGGRAVHGPGFAKFLAMQLISTADPIRWDDTSTSHSDLGFLAPVIQVGSGMVNASRALEYTTTSLSLSRFSLNDTHHFNRYHKVDITNSGTKPVTYTFDIQPFGGVEAMNNDPATWGTPRLAWCQEMMLSPKSLVPRVSFPTGKFVLQPGQTKTAQFDFMYPTEGDAKQVPIYSGRILIKGDNGETRAIPYAGVAADVKQDIGDPFEIRNLFPKLTSGTPDTPIKTKTSVTFDLAGQDFWRLFLRLKFATNELRWDIFEASWTERKWVYPPVEGRNGFIGSATSWSNSYQNRKFDPATDDANDVVALPFRDMARDIAGQRGSDVWWFGKLANGTQIAPGKYKMRIAALKIFGNPKNADNWSVFDTPVFEVLPPKN